ncbi:MAG TPA: hypothetical protein VIJ70_02450 [Gaiellaceae bacterium]
MSDDLFRDEELLFRALIDGALQATTSAARVEAVDVLASRHLAVLHVCAKQMSESAERFLGLSVPSPVLH